jgi:hypothetical protein
MAKGALKSRLGDIAQGHFNLEKVRKPVPFSKLAEKYKEFAALFGDTPLAEITTWQIEKWKAESGKRLNPVTVNRRLIKQSSKRLSSGTL